MSRSSPQKLTRRDTSSYRYGLPGFPGIAQVQGQPLRPESLTDIVPMEWGVGTHEEDMGPVFRHYTHGTKAIHMPIAALPLPYPPEGDHIQAEDKSIDL